MNTKYNKSHPRIGATGHEHKSAAEAKASFVLAPFGWIPYENPFPLIFADSEGESFRACPDFYHPATGFYAEFKAEKLNGKGTKQAADKAVAEIEKGVAQGLIPKSRELYKKLKNAWNHSIQKIACCSKQLPANMPLVLIYEKEQDLNEERRCKRNGIFMLSLENMHAFNFFLRMSSIGLDVGFSRNGFHYKNLVL